MELNEQNLESAKQQGGATLSILLRAPAGMILDQPAEILAHMSSDLKMISAVLDTIVEERSSQPTDFA